MKFFRTRGAALALASALAAALLTGCAAAVVGGAVGTGVEFSFAANWSAAVEYDHMFMGTRADTFVSTGVNNPVGTLSRVDNIHQDVDMVTAHINYRWGGPVISKY